MPPTDQPSVPNDPFLAALGNLVGRIESAMAEQRLDDVSKTVADVFAAASEWAAENPTPELMLLVQGNHCEEKGDWTGADASYRAILDLPQNQPKDGFSSLRQLARLCEMLGREPESLEYARQATSAARLSQREMLLAMTLSAEAHFLLRHELLDEAEAAVAEMFSLMEDNSWWDQLRARAHVLRAECELSRGNDNAAEVNLERALKLLEPTLALAEAAGIQATLSTYWSVTARLRAARGDHQGAIAAWGEAVTISRHIVTLPQLSGAYASFCVSEMLQGQAAALAAAGFHDESRITAEERTELMKQMGLPLASQ